jgi:hypothetical protein
MSYDYDGGCGCGCGHDSGFGLIEQTALAPVIENELAIVVEVAIGMSKYPGTYS